MDLHYKGVNYLGRHVWLDRSLARPYRPEGLEMEEWQVEQYKAFHTSISKFIGRDLTKEESETVAWLSGREPTTINNILRLIESAKNNNQ